MDILELFLDSQASSKATAATPGTDESELHDLVQEFKDAPTSAESTAALKAILKLLK